MKGQPKESIRGVVHGHSDTEQSDLTQDGTMTSQGQRAQAGYT